jgi:hypothetical protein
MISRISRNILPGPVVGMILGFGIICAQVDAVDEQGKDKEDEARKEVQLKNMRRAAAAYTLSPADDLKRHFKFHEDPVIRFSNPVLGTKDGTAYIWSDRGRPQAIVKLYTWDNEHFSHEWQSLSENALVAERDGKTIWSPTGPGIRFQEVPDAPKPAATMAERLRQMKSLAGKFSATYTHGIGDQKPSELRLLPQPVFRFELKDDPQSLDGALFVFVQGTGPIGLLLLEARKKGEGHQWQYAFAKLAGGSVVGRYEEKDVFTAEKYDHKFDPKQTFLILQRQPMPKE